MKMLDSLIGRCSVKVRLALVKADLIPQVINTLNPLLLSFAEAVGIHNSLLNIVSHSSYLETPRKLASLDIHDENEQQAAYEIVLKQVIVPSEQYICHLCVNRYSRSDC
ncbi:hypothetical protein BLNAU_10806 [Blattamonas nauphoetae]|uniref:Uncharacterized protein n=1 Tax=Blattamonas nauphoetae TaxID=2049346 RepID=A0ABQ9XPF6_9EUKA|nr:hypothetical protein BLNAU_10806 [Blattamonas nauphoetae]